MSQIVLIFDVETTGLVHFENLPNLDIVGTDQYPYITQLSWVKYDVVAKRIIDAFDSYIRIPDHVLVPDKVTEITGITAEICQKHGRDIVSVLFHFYQAVISSNLLVGHNMKFDKHMVQIELHRNLAKLCVYDTAITNMFRIDWLISRGIRTHCTMITNTERCNIRPNGWRYAAPKWPSLSELHYHLFRSHPENMHNSLFDVMACMRCFLATDGNYHVPDIKYTTMLRGTTKLAAEHALTL